MNYFQKVQFVNNNHPANTTIRQRIESAICKSAIFALDGGDDANPNAAQIKANAKKAIESPALEVTRFAWYLAFDGTIEGIVDANNSPTDAQIQAVVDAKRAVAWGVL